MTANMTRTHPLTNGAGEPSESGTPCGSSTGEWVEVAPLDRLPVDRGVAALIGTRPVAVFRLAGDEVLAIDHIDPFTGMPVLARGLVGSVGDRITVASPLHKQRFDLRTGACLDDPGVTLDTWAVEVGDGMVRVAGRPR